MDERQNWDVGAVPDGYDWREDAVHVRGEVELPDMPPPPVDDRTVMDNPPACGAPKHWRWGYLPCGCRNDGHGRHVDG